MVPRKAPKLTLDLAGEFPLAAKIAYRTLRRMNHHEDAEDAVQDAALRTLTTASKYRGDAKFSTWFTRVARNERGMRARSTKEKALKAAVEIQDFMAVTVETPERLAIREQRMASVRKALEGISERRREAFLAFFFEGWTIQEIASQRGVTTGAIKSRIFKASQLVREALCSSPQR